MCDDRITGKDVNLQKGIRFDEQECNSDDEMQGGSGKKLKPKIKRDL